MTHRSFMRLVMAILWLAGGIFLCFGVETERGVMWQSYPAAGIAFLMVAYNLLLVWYYWKKKRPKPEDEDAF